MFLSHYYKKYQKLFVGGRILQPFRVINVIFTVLGLRPLTIDVLSQSKVKPRIFILGFIFMLIYSIVFTWCFAVIHIYKVNRHLFMKTNISSMSEAVRMMTYFGQFYVMIIPTFLTIPLQRDLTLKYLKIERLFNDTNVRITNISPIKLTLLILFQVIFLTVNTYTTLLFYYQQFHTFPAFNHIFVRLLPAIYASFQVIHIYAHVSLINELFKDLSKTLKSIR